MSKNDDLIDADYDFDEEGEEEDMNENEEENDIDDEELDGEDTEEKPTSKNNKNKTQLRKDAQEYSKNLEKRGVVYMSRIPPGMKPNKARTLFEQFGDVTRIYLQEEDASQRQQRKNGGGNGSKQFKEGWIEFSDKKMAKSVAESLNNTSMGGAKSHSYHDDIWNLKYLKNFKWDYLTEKFAYERRVRETKLRASMMQAKRANAEFVELVEKGKQEKFIAERKRKRSENDGDGSTKTTSHSIDSSGNNHGSGTSFPKIKRSFLQQQPISRDPGGINAKYVDDKLIHAVFAKKSSSSKS